MAKTSLDAHKIVSGDEWLKARKRVVVAMSRSPYKKLEAYSRGIDLLNPAYNYLYLVPKGRDEARLEWPMGWVRHHDKYGNR